MDRSWYQVSDLEDLEFYREIDLLDIDAVFRLGIDTPFSPTLFEDLEMGGSAENPILLDEQEGKKNSLPNTTVSGRPNTTPCIVKKSSVGNKNRKCSRLCL